MIERKTILSPDRVYRYTLWRTWGGNGDLFRMNSKSGSAPAFVQFIGLNPSTADETADDPTVRRCVGFAKSWGFGAMCMTNLFAYRATYPAKMKSFQHPIGEVNNSWLETVAGESELTICAWGKDGNFLHRGIDVITTLKSAGVKLFHLGLNGDGTPKHPLYLRADTKARPL